MDVSDAESGGHLSIDGAYPVFPRINTVLNRQSPVISQPTMCVSSQPEAHEKNNIQRRIKSFVKWTGNALPTQLAIAGFIFTGQGDKVQCEDCNVKLFNWDKNMVPLEEHRKQTPNCGFLKKWFPLNSNAHTTSTGHNGFSSARAKYQDKVEFTKRLSTFQTWPIKNKIQSPHNMAVAGFFYIGSADRARCFNCGLTLRDWDTDDDPFAVHLQWAPKCEYVNHIQKNKKSKENLAEKEPSGFTSNQAPRQALAQALTPEQAPITQAQEPAQASADTTGGVYSSCGHTKWTYSTQFEAVMAMGFQAELIQKAIDNKIRKTGDGFLDVTSLFIAVEDLSSAM